jgi:cytochrome c-type biogenesis protein CcmF
MLGMIIAHFGFAVFLAGVLVTEGTSIEKDVRLDQGETAVLANYTFRFDGVERVNGPNFVADQGTITVTRGDTTVAVLHPQKRQYTKTTQIQTESDIDPGFTRDLYVALGEPLGDTGAWSVRVYLKPFIRWIWLGAILMMIGGFVTATDRRFRVLVKSEEPGEGMPAKTSPATAGADK